MQVLYIIFGVKRSKFHLHMSFTVEKRSVLVTRKREP
jgi:hypothetical protein